jgi:hypothetical protein
MSRITRCYGRANTPGAPDARTGLQEKPQVQLPSFQIVCQTIDTHDFLRRGSYILVINQLVYLLQKCKMRSSQCQLYLFLVKVLIFSDTNGPDKRRQAKVSVEFQPLVGISPAAEQGIWRAQLDRLINK